MQVVVGFVDSRITKLPMIWEAASADEEAEKTFLLFKNNGLI